MLINRRHQLGNLWREFNQVQDEFSKWFGQAVASPTGPVMNVWEDENNVYAEVDLPGVDPAKLEITVTEGNHLTVQGERVTPTIPGTRGFVRRGRSASLCVVELPTLVNAENVEAKYESGVLRLTLPKHEAAKPRKIVVKGE